jgi:prepilin signal peptidase PulO-like enzyme (type II secretory pathway)
VSATSAETLALTFGLLAIAHSCARRYGTPLGPGLTLATVLATSAVLALAELTTVLSEARGAVLACAGVCAASDLQTGYIFDRVLLAAAAAIVAAGVCSGALMHGLLGAGAFAGAVALPFAVSRGRAMGLGDVKFAGTAGLALGVAASMEALWVACVSGGAAAAFGLLTGRARCDTRVPFGPFLALGTCVALLMDPR